MTGKHSRARPPLVSRARAAAIAVMPRTAPAGPAQAPAYRDGAAGSESIFRTEALEFRASAPTQRSSVVRLGAPWIRWGYLLTLALVAGGVVLIFVARTSQTSFGTAAVGEPAGQFTALLPAAVLSELSEARSLRVALPGNRSQAVPVARLRMRLATDSAVRRAGLALPTEPSVLLTGRVTLAGLAGALPHHSRFVTSVTLILRSQPIAGVLARELAVILGQREAGQ